MKHKVRVLFICKKGQSYGSYDRKFSGLFNSTSFVSDAIDQHECIVSKVVQVNDNNDIDREVYAFQPNFVIIEAFWVIPEKFKVLRRLHPKVKWYVHLHSDIPFIAQEGMAIEWIRDYLRGNVGIIANSNELIKAIHLAIGCFGETVYLPNCYPVAKAEKRQKSDVLDVGCFGAIRPLKNQLIQACAAIGLANKQNKRLRFHINSTRVEGGGSVLRNLRALFNRGPHALIEHGWHPHRDFIKLIKQMEVIMQVSYSETFNIVAADAISSSVPVVASPEIDWLSPRSHADPNFIDDIMATMEVALVSKMLLRENRTRLKLYTHCAKRRWVKFILGC